MKRTFADLLHSEMEKNSSVWLIVFDLGYKVFDQCFLDFPERCINVGAAEQAGMGIAVGLALEGKIVFCYTITSFYLRCAETIGLYLHSEQAPVKFIGAGRDQDYSKDDGITHDCELAQDYLKTLNIIRYWPEKKEEIDRIFRETLMNEKPTFISLHR